ncbi:hypothetical protein PFDG_05334, partial [Plasmodium falciparum Dd2]
MTDTSNTLFKILFIPTQATPHKYYFPSVEYFERLYIHLHYKTRADAVDVDTNQ